MKGPVLSPDAKDKLGDRNLTAKEIQKAAYHFLPGSSIVDVQHNFKKQAEVVESYIAPDKTKFNGETYPAGTWFLTSRITDPEIGSAILNGTLTGHSVGAYPDTGNGLEPILKGSFKGSFDNVDEGQWFPLTVSLVKNPRYEGMNFKVFQPDEVIKKGMDDKEDENMGNGDLGILDKLAELGILKGQDDEEVNKLKKENKELKEKNKKLETKYEKELDKINKRIDKLNKSDDEEEDEEEEDEEEEEEENKEDKKKKGKDKKKDKKKSKKKDKKKDKKKTKDDEEDEEDEEDIEDDEDEEDEDEDVSTPNNEGVIAKGLDIDSVRTKKNKGLYKELGLDSFGRNKKYLK